MKIKDASKRKEEQGQTIALVALSLVALVGLAALAIDVSSLYVSKNEAQSAADAAALAGARMFSSSSFVSRPTVFNESDLCVSGNPGSGAAVNQQAMATANQNSISNRTAAITDINCVFATGNPQVTVTVKQDNIKTFFSRLWNSGNTSVSAKATAEAYNASGQTVPVQVVGAKPWALANCDQGNTTGTPNPNCPGFSVFVKNDGSLENGGAFIGEVIPLAKVGSGDTPTADSFYPLNFGPTATSCPRFGGPVCTSDASYRDDIQCSSPVQLTCGKSIGAGGTSILGSGYGAETIGATKCLIHADADNSLNAGQDRFAPTGGSAPITIAAGAHNPNSSLAGQTNISRSDSIVTVPLFNGANLCPSPTGPCTGSTTIIGFMQLGIRQTCTNPAACLSAKAGQTTSMEAVILNAVGCSSTTAAVSGGGGSSPIAVRLINP
ncbi:MAG TPA: pilus assembly protein TadG-related protein [Terriglobales bacterium]|jgi:hypothetical protein|nr:pilus assembly protein TadG-related protein [Terriglobales bacterium]